MFTLQSGQIENALRTVGVPDVSAREMMSGMANCQSVIEHRGPVALTQPTINYFPTIKPAGPTISPKFANDTKNTFVNIPPWQNVPFTPLPYLPAPAWQMTPFPEWPTTDYAEPTLRVPGPSQLGPVDAPEANITNMHTTHITNQGDVINEGDIINQGDTYVQNTTIDGRVTVQNGGVFNGPVTYNGPVYNSSEANNNVVHNQYTVNHGPVENYGDVTIRGVPLRSFSLPVVTNVLWDGTLLRKRVKTVRVFGVVQSETTTTVLDCGA